MIIPVYSGFFVSILASSFSCYCSSIPEPGNSETSLGLQFKLCQHSVERQEVSTPLDKCQYQVSLFTAYDCVESSDFALSVFHCPYGFESIKVHAGRKNFMIFQQSLTLCFTCCQHGSAGDGSTIPFLQYSPRTTRDM